MNTTKQTPPVYQLIEPLTFSEEKVLALMAKGFSDKEIGLEMSITPMTIRGDHKQNIYDKLGLQKPYRCKKWAVHCAHSLGLVHTIDDDLLPFEIDNPYKGLDAFQEQDAVLFFGRGNYVDQLLARVEDMQKNARFLALIGASGSGKSSLVRAGLIPALRQSRIESSSEWLITTIFPRVNPYYELESALKRLSPESPNNLLEMLQRDAYGLIRVCDLLFERNQTILVVIDQFEELFTLVESEQVARDFMDTLYTASTDPRSKIRIIITIRADFLDRPLMIPDFSWLIEQNVFIVGPMSPDEIERVITQPARQARVEIDHSVVAKLVAESTQQPGALPLLEFALTELYDNRIGNKINTDAYAAMGGLQKALASQADKVFKSLTKEQQEVARQLFLRLVTLGEGTEDVRRRMFLKDLTSLKGMQNLMEPTVQHLVGNRLLTMDIDYQTGESTIEIAHEALIREWERLGGWLDESRADVRLERLLGVQVAEWEENNHSADYLMRGSRLAQFIEWREIAKIALSEIQNTFLDASIAEQKRVEQIEQERRESRRKLEARARIVLRALVVVFGLAFIVSGVLALVANNERVRAEENEFEAKRQASIGLAALAREELDGFYPERGVLVALEALENYPYTSQAESALADSVISYLPYLDLEYEDAIKRGGGDGAWSNSGDYVMIGTNRGNIETHIYDTRTGQSVRHFLTTQDNNCALSDVAWSPDDDRVLISAGTNAESPCPPSVWDVETGELLMTLPVPGTGFGAVDWSSDGAMLLFLGQDGVLRISDAETGEEMLVMTGHDDFFLDADADFSPSNEYVATASADGTARIWDAITGEQLTVISVNTPIYNLAWSPDSQYIVTASDDGIARIFDAMSGNIVLTYPGHTDAITGIDWSANSNYIASVSEDSTLQIWDASTGKTLATQQVEWKNVSWSPTEDRVFGSSTYSIMTNTRIVDLSKLPKILMGHTGLLYGAYVSPDEKLIATSGRTDNTVRIWDAETAEQLQLFEFYGPAYLGWSPDSTRIVISGNEPIAKVWDVNTGEVLLEIPAPSDTIFFTADWSPDGSQIVTGTYPLRGEYTSNVILYDAKTGEENLVSETLRCLPHRPYWHPDGDLFVTGCLYPDSEVYPDGNGPGYVWDAKTGKIVMTLESVNGATLPMHYSPDGKQIVAGYSDGTIIIWDAETGTRNLTLNGHGSMVNVDWSPDSKRVISGDMDGIYKIWDIERGVETTDFTVPGFPETLEWSTSGDYVVIGGYFPEPVIRRVWTSTEELIAEAYECCVTRELTPEERQSFGLPTE